VSSRSLNKVILIGNLGADPEVRSTNNGTRVATLSVATSRQWNGQGGDKQEKTEWHKVILWNNSRGTGLADIAEKFCKKGDKVYVEGRIEYRSWQDREGQTRYTTEINGRELILLSGKGEGSEAFSAPSKVAAGAAAPQDSGERPDAPQTGRLELAEKEYFHAPGFVLLLYHNNDSFCNRSNTAWKGFWRRSG